MSISAKEPILRVNNVSKSFGGVRAVDSVSFEVNAGTVHGIIGPNGAGKTTLFNIICGALPLNNGSIFVDGVDVTGKPASARAARGVLRTFQNLNLVGDYSVIENIMTGGLFRHGHGHGHGWRSFLMAGSAMRWEEDLWERAHDVAAELDLWAFRERRVTDLPAPIQRRVEIGRALMGDPKILLLDEPVAGMSGAERMEVMALIERLLSRTTVLLVEHDMNFVMRVCEHLSVLDQGRLIADGSSSDVRSDQSVIDAYLGESV